MTIDLDRPSQPRDLSFAKLIKKVPLRWVEQREQFGFPPRDKPKPLLFLRCAPTVLPDISGIIPWLIF